MIYSFRPLPLVKRGKTETVRDRHTCTRTDSEKDRAKRKK